MLPAVTNIVIVHTQSRYACRPSLLDTSAIFVDKTLQRLVLCRFYMNHAFVSVHVLVLPKLETRTFAEGKSQNTPGKAPGVLDCSNSCPRLLCIVFIRSRALLCFVMQVLGEELHEARGHVITVWSVYTKQIVKQLSVNICLCSTVLGPSFGKFTRIKTRKNGFTAQWQIIKQNVTETFGDNRQE